jgi:hypothetical protein
MANTWTAWFPGVIFAAGKNMAAILNTGARVLRVKRVGLLNGQTAGVTGQICNLELRIYRGTATLSAPTSVTPVAHDSTNSALSGVTSGYAGTLGGTPYAIRRLPWSSDEAKLTTLVNNELEGIVPLNIIYDSYGDSNVQPIVLRQNEMLCVYSVAGTAGLLDSWIEFLDEAT